MDGRTDGRDNGHGRTDGGAAALLYHFTKESIRAAESKTEEGRSEGRSVRATESRPNERRTEAHHLTPPRRSRARASSGGNGGWREGGPAAAPPAEYVAVSSRSPL